MADIGCHTLGYLPPYEMGQLLMCMGASTAMGSGLGLFNDTRRVVAFMGDSTFFHAALPGVINARFNRHNLTLVLMENGTTAMTGHQDHAASGRNFNTDTVVGIQDLSILATNWSGGDGSATIPEPGALMLLALGSLALGSVRKR